MATTSSTPATPTAGSPSDRRTSEPSCSTAAHRHRRPAGQCRAPAAPLQPAGGGRVVPAAADAHTRLRAPSAADPGRRNDTAVSHRPEPGDVHTLQRVRPGRQQHGRRPALRRDRHRRLPAFAGMELRRQRHLLSEEETTMRRTLSIASSALALAAALVVCACTDLLTEDPKGFTTTDTFYKTGADLNSATIAIYNSLRGMQGHAQWTTPELASDQTRADNREPNLGTSGPDFLDWDASTGNTGGYWGTAYSMITRANLVLANGPGIDAPNAQIKAYNLAEAKFMRGYAYLWLVKVYDDVPLLLSPAEQANPQPTRTPVEQVDQAIIKDLTEAAAALPE